MDILDGVAQLQPAQIPEPCMPPEVFMKPEDLRFPVLTRPTTNDDWPYLDDRPAIRLSRMVVARNMIAQLGLHVYAEGIDRPFTRKYVAWVRYDLPVRESPYVFRLKKTYGNPRRSELEAFESLGSKLIQEIMLETGYNVDDLSYRLCTHVCSQFKELYHIAGGTTLMADCARLSAQVVVDSLDGFKSKLSRIFSEFDDVLPFSKIRALEDGVPAATWMEELAKELVALARGDESSLDDID